MSAHPDPTALRDAIAAAADEMEYARTVQAHVAPDALDFADAVLAMPELQARCALWDAFTAAIVTFPSWDVTPHVAGFGTTTKDAVHLLDAMREVAGVQTGDPTWAVCNNPGCTYTALVNASVIEDVAAAAGEPTP